MVYMDKGDDNLSKTPTKCQITIGEISNVFDLVLDGNKSIYTNTKRITTIYIWINSCLSQDIGVEHTSSHHFYPSGLLAQSTSLLCTDGTRCIYFKSWFYKGEVSWSHPDRHFFFKDSGQKCLDE